MGGYARLTLRIAATGSRTAMPWAEVRSWWPALVFVVLLLAITVIRPFRRRIRRLVNVSRQWITSRFARAVRWLKDRSTSTRRLTAACFFAAALVLTLISSFTSYLQTCEEQIARVGTMPAVRTCGPMSITDAPILILFVAAGVLLLPE
jgi:hypothetical protein